MKKIILFKMFFLFLSISIFGQHTTKIGINLGANFSNGLLKYNGDPVLDLYLPTGGTFNYSTKMVIGGMGSYFVEWQIFDDFFLQPELKYVQKGFELTTDYNDPSQSVTTKWKSNYYEIPILIKYRLMRYSWMNGYILAGPNFGFIESATCESSGQSFDVKSNFSKDFSIEAGIEADFPIAKRFDILANLRYSYGLSDVYNDKNWDDKLNGLQIMAGIKYCLFGCDKVEEKLDEKAMPLGAKLTKGEVIKLYDFGKYDIPFFVSGYYRPNTTNNLEVLFDRVKNELKNAGYIEKFTKNSAKHKQYKLWAQSIDNIFNSVLLSSCDELFPNFKENANSSEGIEIVIYGYADPRPMSGQYFEDEAVNYESKKGNKLTVNKGDPLNNDKLSGLRSYYSGKLLDNLFSEKCSVYNELKNAGRIKFRNISVGVNELDSNESTDLQRKIKIVFSKISLAKTSKDEIYKEPKTISSEQKIEPCEDLNYYNTLKYGIRVGVNYANFTGSGANNMEARIGFTAGGFIIWYLSPDFAIQPELLYSMKGADITNSDNSIGKLKIDYIDLPVLLRYNFPVCSSTRPFITAGPMISYNINSALVNDWGTYTVNDIKKIDIGASFGVGVSFEIPFGRFSLDARYNMGFSTIHDVSSDPLELKNSVLNFSLGFIF